jgi:hypothetical protein
VCGEKKMNLPVFIGGKEEVNGVFYPSSLSRDGGSALIFC